MQTRGLFNIRFRNGRTYMREIIAIFVTFMLFSLAFGCLGDDDEDNKSPEAWLTLEPAEATIYDNSTGWTYPVINFNGTATSDPDGRVTYYLFDMGEGNTTEGGEGDNTTTYEYQQPGFFQPSLEVEDDKGSKDKTTKELAINYQMNHVGGPLDEGDSEDELLPVSTFSPYEGTVVVELSHNGLPGSSSDVTVSVLNAADEVVRTETRTGIAGTENVTFSLADNDFDTYKYGEWKVRVSCDSGGTVDYDCTVDIIYKD